MAQQFSQRKQRLSGISRRRVLAVGFELLHEELVVRRRANILELPLRSNGTAQVLQASFFKRLFTGQLELKSCMGSEVSGAQADLRHLSAEQLLAIRTATADFAAESVGHSAHWSFLMAVDVHLFEKLARQCLCPPPSEKPQALHRLGLHLTLVLGGLCLLANGWGEGKDAVQDAEALAVAPESWLLALNEFGWEHSHFGIFHSREISVTVLTGQSPDFAAAVPGSMAVIDDQSVEAGKDWLINWEVSLLDPRCDDVSHELALLRRTTKRGSPPARRGNSAPCGKHTASPGPKCPECAAPHLLRSLHAPVVASRVQPLKTQLLPCEPRTPPLLVPEAAPAPQAQPSVREEESPSSTEGHETPAGAVVAFLQALGYGASDETAWEGELLFVSLGVSEHTEADGHTLYVLDCEVRRKGAGGRILVWHTSKRLLHLRKGLHDLVKRDLGEEEYGRHFGRAPFARHMGVPGTTSRLRTWCRTLATSMSSGLLRPRLVAEVLRFLEVPTPGAGAVDKPLVEEDGADPLLTLATEEVKGAAAPKRKVKVLGRQPTQDAGRARSAPCRKARQSADVQL